MTVKKPKPGTRLSQARVDYAEMAREDKRKKLKRSVKDKATGAMVYPLKDYEDYAKSDRTASKVRIENMTPSQKAKLKKKK